MTEPLTAEERSAAQGRRFPIMYSSSEERQGIKPGPRLIPWSVAELAYATYSAKYGRSQTLEQLAHRGGFYCGEMDEFYPPWRDEVSEIARLRATIAAVEAERDALDATIAELRKTLAEADSVIFAQCNDAGGDYYGEEIEDWMDGALARNRARTAATGEPETPGSV